MQSQAASALYNITVRNADNQTATGTLGVIGKLAAVLNKNLHNYNLVEKVLAALLCTVLKHPINKQQLVR